MATWVDASTDEYWGASGLSYPFNTSFTYMGSGVWENEGYGPGTERLYEYYGSPLKGDPYYYTDPTTIYGIRFSVSFTATDFERLEVVSVKTSNGQTLNYGSDLVFPVGVFTVYTLTFEYTPSIGERPIYIGIGGEFGEFYGSSARIYGIQVSTSASVPEPEPSISSSRLYKITGQTEITEEVPNPPPPYTPPPTIPRVPRPPNNPRLIAKPTPIPNPREVITPIINRTGITAVPCSPGPDGEPRSSLWESNTKTGALIRQITPCE